MASSTKTAARQWARGRTCRTAVGADLRHGQGDAIASCRVDRRRIDRGVEQAPILMGGRHGGEGGRGGEQLGAGELDHVDRMGVVQTGQIDRTGGALGDRGVPSAGRQPAAAKSAPAARRTASATARARSSRVRIEAGRSGEASRSGIHRQLLSKLR